MSPTLPDALPPAPVIDVYTNDSDRSRFPENLKLTPGQRLETLQAIAEAIAKVRAATTRR